MNHTPSVRPPYRACPHARRILAAALAAFSIFHFPFSILHSSAAVPLKWTVETSRVQPAAFDVVRGETIELEAAMQSYGNPLSMADKPVFIFWQTNGMDSAWWSATAQVRTGRDPTPGVAAPTNVLAASFTPAMDPGAATVTGFLGSTGDIYRAAFTLRFRKGPGASPNRIEHPVPILDLAHTTVVNPPWPTQADYAATTTVMKAELKDYVDGEIEGAGLITHQAVTNISGRVASNVVTKAYVEGLGIESGLDTNAVASVITNHVTSGYLCTLKNYNIVGDYFIIRDSSSEGGIEFDELADDYKWKFSGFLNGTASYASVLGTPADRTSRLPPRIWRDTDGKWKMRKSANQTAYEIASKNDIPDAYTRIQSDALYAPTSTAVTVTSNTTQLAQLSQSVSAKADAASVSLLQSQVTAIGAHLNAEDAHFVSTNYDSTVRLPEAYVEIRMSNSWITIWREMTRWNRFAGTNFNWNAWTGFDTFRTNVTSMLGELDLTKADRAWGAYDSETGGYSPEGYLQISTPNIIVAKDMAYQRKIATGGAVWILQCNSGTAHIGGDTNGFFRIKDGDGVTQFEVIKGDKQEMGADATGITVDGSTTPPTLTIPYSVEADDHPTIEVCTDLTLADWKAEDSAQCAATVSWSGTSGAYVATVRAKSAPAPSLFVRATYWSGGETYIHNVAPVGMDAIILNGTKYYLGTNTISGKLVLTLSTANPNP